MLLININYMRWRDVGLMGSGYYELSNLDALAAEIFISDNGGHYDIAKQQERFYTVRHFGLYF